MPNGHDKNFVRLCAAIEGFRARFGHWPQRVRLFPGAIEDLRERVFLAESFQQLCERIELVPDEAPMVAEDYEGNAYSYGAEGFPKKRPGTRAWDWLGVHPDRDVE